MHICPAHKNRKTAEMFAKGVICTPHTFKALSFDVTVAAAERFARHHRCLTFKAMAMAMAMGEAPGAITAREKKKDSSGSVNKPPPTPTPTPLISVEPPRGTRDFPPEDMRLRSWLFNNFREVSSRTIHVQRGELPAGA